MTKVVIGADKEFAVQSHPYGELLSDFLCEISNIRLTTKVSDKVLFFCFQSTATMFLEDHSLRSHELNVKITVSELGKAKSYNIT